MNIVNSDAFLELPPGAQALYFHLNMRADDDGFVNSPRAVMRMAGASEEDLRLLAERGYLLCFEGGVVAVTHWRVHNLIRKNRYTPTLYQELLSMLTISSDGAYALRGDRTEDRSFELDGQWTASVQPMDGQCTAQVR